MRTWVNIFHGAYANCTDGSQFYISLGYRTKAAALTALRSKRSKGIMHRYITTIKIKIKIK